MSTYTHNYISAVNDLHAREILNGIVDVTNEAYTFVETMRLKGREMVTTNSIFKNFVNSELYATETINGIPTDNSGGSGQGDVTVVLTNANGTSYPNEGEIVQFDSGHIGRVVSVTADAGGDQVRIKAVDPTVTTANLAAADAEVLSFYGNAAGEGGAGPTPRRYSPTQYSNQTMIIQTGFRISDVEIASRIEVDVNGQPFYVYQGMIDHQRKFMLDEGFLCFFSQISDPNFSASASTLDDADGNPVQTTRGLRQYATSYGVNTSSVTVNSAAFATLTRTLDQNRSPKEYDVYFGANGAIAMDDFFNAIGGSPDLSAARFSVDGREIDLGVRKANLYGRTWNLHKVGVFDHKNVVNFNGSAGFEKDVMFLPVGPIMTTDGRAVERVRIRYMQQPGILGNLNLRYQETNTGALAPTGVTSDDNVWKQTLRSNFGPEVVGPEHMVLWELS
jgi:hypothetical protein